MLRSTLLTPRVRGDGPPPELLFRGRDTKGCVYRGTLPQYFVEFPLTRAPGPCMLGATGM